MSDSHSKCNKRITVQDVFDSLYRTVAHQDRRNTDVVSALNDAVSKLTDVRGEVTEIREDLQKALLDTNSDRVDCLSKTIDRLMNLGF